MFRITKGKGFQITFANGLTASVQWGAGNYCDHYSAIFNDFSCTKFTESSTAEVAVIDSKGSLLDDIYDFLPKTASTDGMVGAYLTPDEVVYFLQKVSERGLE